MRAMNRYLMFLMAALFAPQAAEAATFCALTAPTLETAGGKSQLKVAVACSDTATPGTVPYPEGDLYVGASLYKIDQGLEGKIISTGIYGDADPEHILDLKAIELHNVAGTIPVTFDIANPDQYTHVLIAVWSQKDSCPPDQVTATNGCADFGYTLGPADWYGMPIPIDASPRPVCDKEALTANGYFNWVSESGDPTGNTMPEEFSDSFNLNDCWENTGDVGLGYSVRRWRVGPIPKPAT